jgi:hypothetical protein
VVPRTRTGGYSQQILTFFLELVASAAVENLIVVLPIALARSLRKNTFRWAEKEKRALHKRQDEMQTGTKDAERASEGTFEAISILSDFLDYCSQRGILSRFERQLLIKFKVDGFSAKEIQDRHTVLSERAVLLRIHRIMHRLHDAAMSLDTKTNGPITGPTKTWRKKSAQT